MKTPEDPVEQGKPHNPRKTIRVDEMLAGAVEAILLHAGEEYRLRITRNGKLILTK